MVTGVSTLASALVHPPAHAAIETRHHTLAELAPRPVVAGLAPALQEVPDPFLMWYLHVSLWMHWPPCWQGREQMPPSQLRPWKPAGQSHTPGAEQLPPFMHCGEQTGKLQSSPSQPGRQMHLPEASQLPRL